MRIILAILVFITMPFSACHKSTTDQCPSTTYRYSFRTNAGIDTSRTPANWLSASIVGGSKLVFNYERNYSTCPEIADGGSTNILFLEVDPSVTSFDYEASGFRQRMVYFRRICFCTESGFLIPNDGRIKGNRIDDRSWKIDVDIVVSNGESIKTSAIYKLQ
jgi:hypothetical protein